MKKRLLKMRVCIGFEFHPSLDVITYEDELSPDGKPYRSFHGPRNEKTLAEFGQPWMKFCSTTNEPYFDSYVILDAENATEQEIAEKAAELYKLSLESMKNGLDDLMDRFGKFQIPSQEEILNAVREKTGNSLPSSGKYVVPVEKFKELIRNNALEEGKKMAAGLGVDVQKWQEFYANTLTPDILSLLMKGLPVLKFSGDGIEFQNEGLFNNAINVVSKKVSGDVFARFMETRDK